MFKVGDLIQSEQYGVGIIADVDTDGFVDAFFSCLGRRFISAEGLRIVKIQDSGIENQEFKVYTPEPKMTLRDRFAMAALSGILSSDESDCSNDTLVAKGAYAFADAMLKAREAK